MAIKSNKKIDFEYEHENGGDTYSFSLRLHTSAEYGVSIALLDDNGDVAINFPAAMFPEITEFLIEQGVIESKKPAVTPTVKLPKPSKPTLSNKQTVLPKPRIVSTRNSNVVQSSAKSRDIIPVDLENDSGDDYAELPMEIRQKLEQENDRISQLGEALEGATPMMTLSEAANQSDLSDDEIESILQERQNAAKKASSTGVKKIRKRDGE